MNISIVGAGYVGLVTGACFAEMGNHVHCVDADQNKLNLLQKGCLPIYEPGLAEMILRNQQAETLRFGDSIREALETSKICFIAVATPMADDGGADLRQVYSVAEEIGRHMSHDMIVANKSTVPVGTAARVAEIIAGELANRGAQCQCRVISNPEFLKEGSAVADCLSPDRIIIGTSDMETAELMKELYAPFVRTSDRIMTMDITSAELTKYAANAMLATRISFMNEMARLCEAVGADINQVRLGLGSDNRIGYSFLFAGCGYGGSCFPKDIQALIKTSRDVGCSASLMEAVERINHRQKLLLVEKAALRFGDDFSGLKFAVWGLSFKPNTDDVREAPALTIIPQLLKKGAQVRAYDPQAMESIQTVEEGLRPGENLQFVKSKYSALTEADALLLLTEWKEFRSPDFLEMKARMKSPVIFDGRNQYKAPALKKLGFEYYQIGVPAL